MKVKPVAWFLTINVTVIAHKSIGICDKKYHAISWLISFSWWNLNLELFYEFQFHVMKPARCKWALVASSVTLIKEKIMLADFNIKLDKLRLKIKRTLPAQ